MDKYQKISLALHRLVALSSLVSALVAAALYIDTGRLNNNEATMYESQEMVAPDNSKINGVPNAQYNHLQTHTISEHFEPKTCVLKEMDLLCWGSSDPRDIGP